MVSQNAGVWPGGGFASPSPKDRFRRADWLRDKMSVVPFFVCWVPIRRGTCFIDTIFYLFHAYIRLAVHQLLRWA